MKRFGLLGFPLTHSYSQNFFENKFKQLDLKDHVYDLFEMENLENFTVLFEKHPDLVGLNVTVPHKRNIIPLLDHLDKTASKVGACNVILNNKGKLIGYNTDYMAFKNSFSQWIGKNDKNNALVLGTGGASHAVTVALSDLGIPYQKVSRSLKNGDYTYQDICLDPHLLEQFHLLINTTPLGMYPQINTCPDLPYEKISSHHFLYDLVYNPEKTLFLKRGKIKGAKTKNGLEMLKLQAEHSWTIWSNHI